MPIIELQSLPEVRIGHTGPVLVSVWRSQATLKGMQAMAGEQRKLIAEYGTICTVAFAVKIPQAPGPEVSEWLKTSEKEFKGTSRGTVVVVLERGLAAIIARSFIAVASLISSNAMLVVKTVDEAADKVRTMPGQSPEISGDAELAAKFEAFIAR
jgi:hypothetical protein